MSDDLTPQQTDAVRRALRSARHEAPLPDEVAARLDATLAGLVADRTTAEPAVAAAAASAPADGSGRVVLLRRRWPAFLAAAAAVTAIGLAGTQYVDGGGNDSGAASSADSSGPESSALAESRDDAAVDALEGPEVLSQLDGPTAPTLLTDGQRAALAEAGYGRIELAPTSRATSAYDERSAAKSLRSPTPAPGADTDLNALARRCSLPDLDLPTGLVPTYYLARHEGEQVVLVVLPGPEVTAYPCGSGTPTPLPLG